MRVKNYIVEQKEASCEFKISCSLSLQCSGDGAMILTLPTEAHGTRQKKQSPTQTQIAVEVHMKKREILFDGGSLT